MKKFLALALVLMLALPAAFAAEWPEGRSAAQPYAGVPEVDLGSTMGYIIMYPRAKLPARLFCDLLEMYLPREDVTLGEGTLTLYEVTDEGEEIVAETVSFSDADAVGVRPLAESELANLMWGGGVCVYAKLARSLEFGKNYFVTMDGGCFTASGGTVKNIEVPRSPNPAEIPNAWVPVIEGNYGLSGLYYQTPAAPEAVEATEEAGDETEAADAAQDEAPAEIHPTRTPAIGDEIHFDVVLGGDAATAVVFTGNDSVFFDVFEFTQSGPVTGVVTGDSLSWGVVFLDASGQTLDVITLGA